MAHAVATFIDDFLPSIGICTEASDKDNKSELTPLFSEPKIKHILSFPDRANSAISILFVVIFKTNYAIPRLF